MKKTIIGITIIIVLILGFFAYKNKIINAPNATFQEHYKAQNNSQSMSCKLTSAEMQERKATVLASLIKQVKEKKELADGYAFKFEGSDKMLDELTEFIKTERSCCDFFTFGMSVSGDKSEIWLEVTGSVGAKYFITSELGL